MRAYDTIVTKRDLRHTSDRPVTDDDLAPLLQAARMAGSAKNDEANRLVVCRSAEVRTALAGAGDFTSWIDTVPVVIAFAAPDDKLRLFDVGRQAQNLMLAAHELGMATCPVTFQHHDRSAAAVRAPLGWTVPMAVTVGWPLDDAPASPLQRTRVGLDELVHEDGFPVG